MRAVSKYTKSCTPNTIPRHANLHSCLLYACPQEATNALHAIRALCARPVVAFAVREPLCRCVAHPLPARPLDFMPVPSTIGAVRVGQTTPHPRAPLHAERGAQQLHQDNAPTSCMVVLHSSPHGEGPGVRLPCPLSRALTIFEKPWAGLSTGLIKENTCARLCPCPRTSPCIHGRHDASRSLERRAA